MNRIMKITMILITIFILLAQISLVYASSSINPGDYDPSKYRDSSGEKVLGQRAKIITTTIRAIGIVVSVVTLMIIGIKEMTASAEEKSILKQAMPGYILGAVMVFAMTVIPTLIYEFAKGL